MSRRQAAGNGTGDRVENWGILLTLSPRRILIFDACVDRLTADNAMRFSSQEQHRAGGRSGLGEEFITLSSLLYRCPVFSKRKCFKATAREY